MKQYPPQQNPKPLAEDHPFSYALCPGRHAASSDYDLRPHIQLRRRRMRESEYILLISLMVATSMEVYGYCHVLQNRILIH